MPSGFMLLLIVFSDSLFLLNKLDFTRFRSYECVDFKIFFHLWHGGGLNYQYMSIDYGWMNKLLSGLKLPKNHPHPHHSLAQI